MYDVVVIGGGVVGGLIVRQLTKYTKNVCLLEKGSDVCVGQSKANSGIAHAGHDAKNGTLKAKFNLLGRKMMPSLCKELGVKFRENGSLVVAFSKEERAELETLKKRGEINGVTGLKILEKAQLFAVEPVLSKEAECALFAPGAIVCPYTLTVNAIGNAMDNGATLKTSFDVVKAEKIDGGTRLFAKSGESVDGKYIVNTAGLASGTIASLFGDEIEVKGRKGEYLLLDKGCGNLVKHTLFFAPTKKGKGVLITPTVDGNLLVGPTSEEIEDENTETSGAGIRFIQEKAKKMFPALPLQETITSFAGVRAYSTLHDFQLLQSDHADNVFHVAGIESPGLTSAPAIAEYVVAEWFLAKTNLVARADFNPYYDAQTPFHELSIEEQNERIRQDPSFGKIVCRCEKITEGEIRRAIRQNPPARDLDAVKRRTRTGMGRCQGGFCSPQIMEIIADELQIPLEEVTKKGGKSTIVGGRTK